MDGLAQAWEEADPVETGGFEASPDAPNPAGPREPASNYFDEEGFQDWYGRWSTIAGIDPDPDAPEHKYDYRAAYKVDAKPEFDEPSGTYHWPSAFKADDHPDRYIDNFDTKSGIDMQAEWDEAGAPDSAIDRKVMPDMPEGAYDRPTEKERAGDDEEYQKRLEKQLAANERAVPVIGKHSVSWLPDLIKDTDAFRDFVSGQAVDRSGLLLNKQRELLRKGKDLTDKEKAYLEDMQLVAGYNSTSKGLASFIPATAEVIGQQFEAATSPEKNPYAMGVAAAGGAAATAAMVSGPGAVVTAPAAAAAAGGAAFAAGTLTRTSAIEAGQAFDEFRKLKDENGNTITLQQALFASDIVGSINGALEVAGLGVAAKLIPGVRNLFKDGVRGFLRQPTVGKAFVDFLKTYAQGWTGEVSTEMAQEMNNIVTSGILQGKGIAETMKDPQTAEQLSEIFDKVGKAMAVLGAVGGGVNLASDIRTAVNMRGDARTVPGKAPIEETPSQKSINPVIDSWVKDLETGLASGTITKDDIQGMLSEMKDSNPVKERLQKIIGAVPETTAETPAAPVAPAAAIEGYTPATADDINILSDYLSRGINKGTEFKVQAATETKDAAMVQRVSGALGLKTVFFEGEGAADGVNGLYEPKSGTIFINSNAEKPHLVVLGHETLHRMHTEHPDLWDRLHFLTKDLKEDFDQYVSVVNQSRRNRGFKEISPEKVLLHQEFMADFVGQQFANPKFWEKLNKHDATLGQQAAKYVVELIEKIRQTLRGQKVADAKYFKQLNDVQDALASTYAEFTRREKKVKDTTVQAVAPAVSVAPAGAGVAVVPGGMVPTGQTAPVAPAASQAPGWTAEGVPVRQPSSTPTAEDFAAASPVADAVPVVAGEPPVAAPTSSQPEPAGEPVTKEAAQLAAETTVPAPQGEAIASKAEPLAETAKETKPAAVEENPVKTEAVEETKPKTKAAPPSAKASRITTLRGAIMKMGGINIGNMKGEFKDVTTGTKFLLKKTGEHLDIAEQRLKADGWLREDENLVDVLRSPENLRRNKVAGEGVAKREQDKTEQEKQFEKEMNYEAEAPPEGDYVKMNAEDLPEGKNLTIIDDSAHGWDIYEVTEKDPFGVTLKDGRTIKLKPGEKVQVRQDDLGQKAEAAPSEPKAPGEKRPWEMTRKEFFEQAKSRITSSGSDSYYNPPDGRRTLWSGTRSKWTVALRQHHSEIMDALRSGEKIPEAVLAEYKDRIVSPEYSEQLKGWSLKLAKMETATQTPYVAAEARDGGAGPGGAPAGLFHGKAIYKTKEEAISEAVRRYYIPEGLLKAGTPSAEKAPVAAEKPDRPTLTLVGEKQMPKVQAEMRTKGKALGKAQQGGIEFGSEKAPDKLELKPEPVSAKETEGAKIVKERLEGEKDRASVKLNPESKLDIPEFIGSKDAIDFGRTATVDQIDEMRRLHGVLADRSQDILKDAKSSTDLELFEKAVSEAYRAQFLEEAVQASAGNAAEMIAKGEWGRENILASVKQNEIAAGRLRYINKNKSREWAQSAGLYLPGEATLLAASDKSISSEEDLVKYNDALLFSVKRMSPTAKSHLDALRAAMPEQFIEKQEAKQKEKPSGTEAMSDAAMKPTPATAGVNTPTVFTKPIPKGSTRSETLKKVEEILGLPIRVGKFRKMRGAFEAAGIYKPGPQVVRLGKANDIEVAAHEVAHHVQNLLGLGGKMPKEVKAMAYAGAKNLNREGFAEFVRYYITDPKKVAAEAPAFLKTFEKALGEHVDVADALTRIKLGWNAWQAAAPVAKVLSVIQRGKKSDKHYSFDELYRDTVDELHPLKLLSDAVKGKTGEALEIAKDPFMLAWLNRGWARKAEQFIRHGTFQMDEAEGVKFTGASLREILAPVEKTGRMELLDAYLVAKRAVSDERIIKGFDRIISKDDFQKTVDELEAEFKDTAEKLYKYNDELVTYLVDSGRISEEVAKAIREKNEFYAPLYRVMDDAPPQGGLSKKKYDSVFDPIKRLKGSSRDIHSPTESMLKNTYAMVNAAERNRVGKAILDITEIDGMGGLVERIPFPQKPDKISKDDFIRLLKQWGDFKSVAKVEQTQRETERVISDLAAAGKTPSGKMVDVAMEALKSRGWSDGEAKQIISRLQSADTPQAKKEIIEKTVEKTVIMTIKEELSLENMPDEVISTFRPNYIAGPNEAIFYDKGKPVLVELEPMLARAVKGLDADGMNILTKILSYPAKWLRAGATLTPEFMARNPMRDQMTAWVYSKYGFIPGWDLVRGIAHIIGKTELYQKYNASGAAHAAMVSLDRDYLSKSLQEITRMQTGAEMLKSPIKAAGRLVFKVVRHPLETLQVLSELTEEGTRVGEFANAFKKEGGDLAALLTAGHAARDITLDFSRVGLKTRSMNAITAFWNASVQGTDKMVRAFKENPGRTFAKSILGVTLPSLLLWYAQHDDPYYEEIPTWRRIMFWNIITHNEDGSLKNIWSIPKPFELGILFGSVPEMALDWMKEKDSKGFQDTMRAAGTALLPGFIPTAAIPVIEAFANRSLFFDRPIVPRNKEEVEPYLQAGPRTSEIVKLGAKLVKDVPGLKEYASPAKIQNMIVGWTGGMGRMTLDAADRMIKEFGLVKVAPEPSMTLDDIPGIRGFHARFPTANTRSIERFYDSYIDNKRKWESIKEEAGIRGKGIRLDPSYKVGMGMEAVLIYQEKAAKTLSLLRKSVDNTYKDPDMDPEQKRVLIDNTYIRMINVARAGLNKKPIPFMDLTPNMQPMDQKQSETPGKLTIQEALKMMK